MDNFFNTPAGWPHGSPFPSQGSGGFESGELGTARHQMVNDLQRVSDALRSAANSFENFSRAFSRMSNQNAGQALGPSNPRASEIAAFLQTHGHLLQPPAHNDSTTTAAVQAPALPRGQTPAVTSAQSPSSAAEDIDPQSKKISKRQQRLMKQAKDPNAPKRPPSAYLLFQNEVRADMKERYPELAYKELLNKVSQAWKALSEEDRKVYQHKTSEEMKRWSTEKKDHEAGQTVTRAGSSSSDEINSSSFAITQALAPTTPAPSAPIATAPSPDTTAADQTTSTKFRKEKKRKDKESGTSKKEKKAKH